MKEKRADNTCTLHGPVSHSHEASGTRESRTIETAVQTSLSMLKPIPREKWELGAAAFKWPPAHTSPHTSLDTARGREAK